MFFSSRVEMCAHSDVRGGRAPEPAASVSTGALQDEVWRCGGLIGVWFCNGAFVRGGRERVRGALRLTIRSAHAPLRDASRAEFDIRVATGEMNGNAQRAPPCLNVVFGHRGAREKTGGRLVGSARAVMCGAPLRPPRACRYR
ncbi:hypothetical protein [Burkholderia thailandensis]|uniref:hypothetical protein n=1 Tax=Burkholderia thailandensis TaxID=57975 RepID=UPI0012B59817|nr:hypothetical protein [Burkholderia thailandensis]MBS2131318.1 hypothetical protein [Burkholderia thailandensis]MCS3400224.1 hypothetical protein [Burkholderia thailandensis]MCS6472543.1 hypothetical protein [Burkholderia thailandensis]MCS6476546.1 hypothetical protein [Burkholderia thailandensis]MCS6495264.1 hypothetical protein [Burkholderia thailandensis]